jgi:lipopolysaccharide export system protein LptA
VRWQKIARLLIGSFVIVFAGVVVFYLRQGTTVPGAQDEKVTVTDGSVTESGKGTFKSWDFGKGRRIDFEKAVTFGDGRIELSGVTITLRDKDDKPVTIKADRAAAAAPVDKPTEITVGKLTGNVALRTASGVEVRAGEATFNDKDGVLSIPGPVEFTKGRLKGSGVGATYNNNNDVFWLLAQAEVHVTPDATGKGALDATSGSAGFARREHYMKLLTAARITSDGRVAEAGEITIILDEPAEKVQQLQLRENSRLTGGATGGAQLMTARDIDLSYGADGRTLQSSKLMENAVVELPGSAAAAPKRINAVTIDIGMSPDGATVTSLQATDRVQVNLPAEGDTPAREITSATLRSTGAAGQGLQNAVFEGGAVYREIRAASGKAQAGERKANAQRLIIDTKPGLGPLERADFRGNAHFEDGKTFADAPRAVYTIDKDTLDLSLAEGEVGKTPTVRNPQLTVDALTIRVSPSTQRLTADTNVRSTIRQQKAGRGEAGETRVPSILKRDSPVYVTSNRLDYDGVAEATYKGNAALWQEKSSRIDADTLVLNEKTGNLKASVKVRTQMQLIDTDPKTKVRRPTATIVTADELVYDDAKRTAIYTATGPALAEMSSPQANVIGRRIDLFLKEGGNELERAEADTNVTVTLDKMLSTGKHLVYTAATENYVLTGEPVTSIKKDEKGACNETRGTTMTYNRATEQSTVDGIPGLAAFNSKPLDACPPALRK